MSVDNIFSGIQQSLPTQVHQLRNLLTVILGGIETDNKEMAKAAVRRMDAQLISCHCCPIFPHLNNAQRAGIQELPDTDRPAKLRTI
jgi:hypothetical protein